MKFQRYLVHGVDAKQLWRRYAVGLSAIVLLLLCAHTASVWAIQAAESDGKVINDSGRQRMLSQRILYFASRHELHDVQSKAEMRRAIDLFETTHLRLSSLGGASASLQALYFGAGPAGSLDQMVSAYISDARALLDAAIAPQAKSDAFQRMRAIGTGPLLAQLNAVVGAYEAEAKNRADWILTVQKASLYLAIVTILIEALVIFLPAQMAAQQALLRLERQKSALQEARLSEARKNAELEAMKSAAEHEALHDPLTGLANRRFLEREMAQRACAAAARGGAVAVLHIDLDKFKEINDTLGHAAGDHVLTHAAERLRDAVDHQDFIARIGGDEFVVLVDTGSDRRHVEAAAERIIKSLRKPVTYAGELCRFSASVGIDIGIVEVSGPEVNASAMLANADAALYRAKELGRDRFVFFDASLEAELTQSRALADELALALRQREFQPIYHPRICAATGTVVGLEAAAHWRHPSRGPLAPEAYLPIAERLDVTADIDAHLVERVLEDVARWATTSVDAARIPGVSLATSLSNLRDQKLVQKMSMAAGRSVDLSIGIAEAALAQTLDDTLRANLDLLREAGVSFEIDMFDASHASLAAILDFAPRRLKISPALVGSAPDAPANPARLTAIFGLADSLGVEVIAQGVTAEAQASLLRTAGASALQGALLSDGLTPEEVVSRLMLPQPWRAETAQMLSA